MLPAEGANSIHDPIHLPKGHTVHPLVQVLEGSLDSIGVGIVTLMVIGISKMEWASLT